ncbi:hypothetical protein [Ralstonia solanacearum]|uniref:hypothetical protein n=1 Tax=Ralstonia solanacearum TaxID=305 RepID=UPI0001D952D4|nr:hypothetical protein [Ralstonia solanacearum]CBJ50358.1 hypothethical protein [Ralstonia solanacearum PSI07]
MENQALTSVYRHLSKEWVNHFFETGELLLTTLPRCREHEEASRRDEADGKLWFALRDEHQIMAGISTAGACSYILCASQSHSAQVQQRFNTDSWIEIFNVQGFAQAVCRAVGSSKRPLFEPCRYAADKSVTRNATSLIATDVADMCEAIRAGKAEDIEQLFRQSNARLAARAAVFERDVYFLKPADPYQVEEEFRFVWFLDEAVSGPKVFNCSEARQFCQRA